jgi:hypothetical protein
MLEKWNVGMMGNAEMDWRFVTAEWVRLSEKAINERIPLKAIIP